MANPSEVATYIRFALSQLPARNGHHEFEHICRYLTQQFICSNVLPATGPVSAGGDQGRDFETFRTYLREELGPHGVFLGLVSEGTIAFVCTIQADNVLAKLRQDIKKVCSSGHSVNEIHAFTLQSVPKGNRQKLQAETQDLYEVRLEFHDGESISNLLARPEGFWIAEQFLSLPADLRPDVSDAEGGLSTEHLERRQRWQEKGSPNPTIGDFIDVKTGLRNAVFNPNARGDLPFWLGILRLLLADRNLPAHIKQHARYELVVATLRGTGTFRIIDDVARAYLNESLREDEPILLQDASALLTYTSTAVRMGLSSLTPTEIQDWDDGLASRIQELLARAKPEHRAILLFTLGFLGIRPSLTEADIRDSSDGLRVANDLARDPPASTVVSVSSDVELSDAPRTLSAWSELMDAIEDAPLFPITRVADLLQLLVPLWSRQPEWRVLLDKVDEAVGQRSGKHIVADRARARAVTLLDTGRLLDALEEFHRVKIDWWSGETLRGSLLAMICIAKLYFEMRLPQASKSYALAVAYIALTHAEEELADLVPAGLLMAARADFLGGAWCSAAELYELGLSAQSEFVEDGLDAEKHPAIEEPILHLTLINSCAKSFDSELTDTLGGSLDRIGVRELVEEVIHDVGTNDKNSWASFGGKGLVGRPFADLGDTRYIRFSALGTEWTVIANNDIESVLKAERFAAAAQVVLAALAKDDLCLVQSRIIVSIENERRVLTSDAARIKSVPSNDGQEWVVRLTSVEPSNEENFRAVNAETATMLTVILRETSLLPEADFSAIRKRAFEKGLTHKLSPGVPFDQLAGSFAAAPEHEIQRSRYPAPWDCSEGSFKICEELRWQDGPGPTYSSGKAEQLLEDRYRSVADPIRLTVEMLAADREFRTTANVLRGQGWLDWHLLIAIANIVIDYRIQSDHQYVRSEADWSRKVREMTRPESATDDPVPIALFTPDAMNTHRRLSMMTLLKIWGLESRRETLDFPAIERLLSARYGYWNDDVPHDDPFPDLNQSNNTGGLVVITDAPSQ